MIKFILGLMLVFGAVGGMDNASQASYFLEQFLLAMLGLILMFWGTRSLPESQAVKAAEITKTLGLK